MTRSTLIVLVLVATVAASCGSPGGTRRNKAGAEQSPGNHILRLESSDGGSPAALYFAARVKEHSHGALTVDIRQSYPATVPANEARLARDLQAGKANFGLLPARAWPAAGVPALATLQAPFVLTSYDVAGRALSGPAGDVLESALEQAGVIPLAMAPTELRRVLAVKPITTLAAFRDLRIRVNDNGTSVADVRELGAQPVQGLTNDEAREAIGRGELDGIETAPIWALSNRYFQHARHLTDYALFARVDTLVASVAAWRHLPDSQKDAIRAAANDLADSAGSLSEGDDKNLAELCHYGVRVEKTSPAELRALADATEPVRAALRANPPTGQIMRLFEATAGAGPQLLPTPSTCTAPEENAPQPPASAAIPNGVYVMTTTRTDYHNGGVYNRDWSAPEYTWTTTLHDGKWERTVVPRFPGQVSDLDGAGTYQVHGDQVAFSYTYPELDASPTETLRWSYYKGRLTLRVVDVLDDGSRVIYTAHPWQKTR